MRPHTEIAHVDDLIWHRAELPRGTGVARQQNLSYDEENGAASTRVRFDAAWSRQGGYHHADTEWYVLSGRVLLGSVRLAPGDYFRAPAGLRVPGVAVAAGSEVMLFREFGDFGFSVSDVDRAGFLPRGGNTASDQPGELTVVRDVDAPWHGNIFDGEAQKVLRLKILYRDPGSAERPDRGWLTNLCWAPPGNVGRVIEHHPVAEEAFGLRGMMTYSYGVFVPGSYFYRPPYIKHAYLTDGGDGHLLLMRVNGHILNWTTEDVSLEVGGDALNYDPSDPAHAPTLAGEPVRSRSMGEWDGTGR